MLPPCMSVGRIEAVRPAAASVGEGRMGRGPTGREPGTAALTPPAMGAGRLTGRGRRGAGEEVVRDMRVVRSKGVRKRIVTGFSGYVFGGIWR